MADRHDYGTFSKAVPRLLKPLIEHLGYEHIKGTAFGRQRDGWIEGFFLHQTGWGGGYFWIEAGINVPQLNELWQNDLPTPFGLIIGERLDSKGLHPGSASYPADNKIELKSSLEAVARDLASADTWFAQFQSLADVARAYTLHNGGALAAVNSGCLLLLAGKTAEAKAKLESARQQWQKIVHDEDPHLQRKSPGKEALKFHQLNVHRLNVVEAALLRLHEADVEKPLT